ncbi:hypothetical protein [Streptomyces colonosanans]|nr:hypothetical protein [Streptomyces colonosanans]
MKAGDIASGALRGQTTGEVYARPGSPGRIFAVVGLTGHGTS